MKSVEEFVILLNDRLTAWLDDERFSCIGKVDNSLIDGMRYAVVDGGKRIRPIAVYLGAISCADVDDEKLDDLLTLACSLELVHSYSLAHDDLPAMDNDDFRRGKPSVHKRYGEANGILIGDALLTLASKKLFPPRNNRVADASTVLFTAAMDMAIGQAYDLADCEDKDYPSVYLHKTAALLSAGFEMGGIIACGRGAESRALAQFGKHVGIAFQLADDLLDEDEQGSILSSCSRDEVRDLIDAHTAEALTLAKALPNGSLLVDFATKLKYRKK